MASLDFYCTASSDDIESINHDRLMALYHVGTDVKRSLLQHYLSEKNLNLANYLSKRYDCIPSDDVKRVTRTKNIQLSDLGVYAIDTLLMKHCYDMFWDCCLHKSSLDHILYTNNTELNRLYQNDLQQDHESPNGLRTLKNLSSTQWSFIIRKTDYQTSSIIPKKGLELTAFDDDMHFVLLSTVCPLYKSVQVVTENQMKISRIAVEHGINNDDYQKIWELMEKKLNTMSSYCNCAGYFKPKLDTLKTSTFNRDQTRDNRKYILDSTFDNPTLLKDSEFVDRVQNELKLIKEEETKSSICRHCARKISFSLDNGKYIPGSYPSALADLAKKDLECCQSVCSRLNVHQKLISTSEKIDVLGQQKNIDRNNYLKLVCLIQEVAKQVLVDLLKGRLPGADLGNALKGMKDRLLPSINDGQKQKMYPEGSKYNGDLSDIDVSLLCIILRKLNTICEHKNGWGKVPEDGDRSISANIDRIRIAKNIIVSHPSNCSMESTEFNKNWEAIRQCCVDLGGDKYEEKIDMLLTSSLDCDRAQKIAESLENERENDYENERYTRKLEDMVDSVKLLCDSVQRKINCTERQNITHNTKSGTLIGLKIEGDHLPSTENIKHHIENYNNEDVSVKSVQEGCLMITLEMFSSAYQNFGHFLAVIDKLLQNIFPAKTVPVDKSGKLINISVKLFQLVEEIKWHPPDLEGKNTKRYTTDNTWKIAKTNQDALKSKTENFSPGKENYDRLMSVFHTGTDVKRCLVETYLHENNIKIQDLVKNSYQTFLTFEDVKRSLRRSSTICLHDLVLSTIDILLRCNCFDMFWDCCLLNTRLEDVLNSHKEELYRIYQNSIRQQHLPSVSAEDYTLSLTKSQWELLFKTNDLFGLKEDGNVHFISATKDITVTSLDNDLNFLLLYLICPLFRSVNNISKCQMKILKLAVLNSEIEKLDFEDLWNEIEANIMIIGRHCKRSDDFRYRCAIIKQTLFNRTLVQDNRKCILEHAFNLISYFIKNQQFCNLVRQELYLIIMEEHFNPPRKLCGKDIPLLHVDGKYTEGAYSCSVRVNAENDLHILNSVSHSQATFAVQEQTEDEIKTYDDGQIKFVYEYFHHLPPDLKVGCFDILILYHDYDYREVDTFRTDLSNIKLSNGRQIQAVLFDVDELISLDGGELDTLEETFERCTFCFIYLSSYFLRYSWCKLISQSCFIETIYNDKKKWCVIPVVTAQRSELEFRIPFGLNTLKEIIYDSSNKQFVCKVENLINNRINEREDRELKLHETRYSYLVQKISLTPLPGFKTFQIISHIEKSIADQSEQIESQNNDQAKTAELLEMQTQAQAAITECGKQTNPSNFLKKCDDKDLVRHWRLIAEASRSVGLFRDPNCTGTGFRVGSKYFITARHVVLNMTATHDIIDIKKLRSRDCYVQFGYMPPNQKQNPENLFHFTDIVYENADLDVIILQLSRENNKSFPPPISMTSEIHKGSDEYIISHPNGLLQISDPKIELYQLKDDVKNSKEWAASKGIDVQNKYSDIENKDKILFHCASKHVASGALGIMVDKRSNEPHGVLMLLRGYPNLLYKNKSFTDAEKTNILIVKQGVLLSSVYNDMKSQEKYNDLVEDINDSLHDLDNIE